jgi:tRNA (mo5U34)-methyltransferase
LQRRLDEMLWYHTIDVEPDVVTKGMFDNRHALPIIPFPDLKGKRCLDIGTCDGLYAFHMERSGATEIIAVDLPDLSQLDYPPEYRHHPSFDRSQSAVQARRTGFHLLHEVLGSKVQWQGINVYDLSAEELGTFDVVVVASLLLHLRDPVQALDKVRPLVRGHLVLAEHIHTPLTVPPRRRPLFELRGEGSDFQWWLGNDRGIRQLLNVGGFDLEVVSPYFLLRYGPYLDKQYIPSRSPKETTRALLNTALTGDRHRGHLHRSYRCRRRF